MYCTAMYPGHVFLVDKISLATTVEKRSRNRNQPSRSAFERSPTLAKHIIIPRTQDGYIQVTGTDCMSPFDAVCVYHFCM